MTQSSAESNAKLLVFPLGCLIAGLILDAVVERFRCQKFSIPSTVFQLTVSCFISFVGHIFLRPETLGHYRDNFTWRDLHPSIALVVLLPILVFDSSFKLESHSLKANLGSVLILAIFGFLLSTAIVGFLMYVLFHGTSLEEDWPEALCFAYGTMVSATDPVAVTSVLGELGAPQRLRVVIEGESLLNDGAAILTFEILIYALKETMNPARDVIWVTVILQKGFGIAGSILMGYVSSIVVIWLLVNAFARDTKKQLAILFCTVYGIFIICEKIQGSAVLSLAVFGICLGSRRDQMHPRTVEEITHLYEFLSYWANCVIFILTGLIIGQYLEESVVWDTLGAGLAAFFFTLVSRGFVFLAFGFGNRCYEVQKKLTPLTENTTYFFIAWAGLKGAVALLLALQFEELSNASKWESTLTEHVVLYAGMTVFLSLLIQGTSAAPLVRCLGINRRSEYKKARLGNILMRLRKDDLQKRLDNFHRDQFYCLAGANWKAAEKIASDALMPIEEKYEEQEREKEIPGIPAEENDPRISRSFFRQAGYRSSKESIKFPKQISEKDLVGTYMHMLLARSWKLWKDDLINKGTARLLIHCIETDLEKRRKLDIHHMIRRAKPSNNTIRLSRLVEKVHHKLIQWKLAAPIHYPNSKLWWFVASFGILCFQCVLAVTVILDDDYRSFEDLHAILFCIFLLCLVAVLEQIALIVPFQSDSSSENRHSYFAYMDFGFGILYLGLAGVIGVSLEVTKVKDVITGGRCLIFNYTIGTEAVGWKTEEDFCLAVHWMPIVVVLLRLVVRLVYCLPLAFGLISDSLRSVVDAGEMRVLASLNVVIRITEELTKDSFYKAGLQGDLILEAAELNKNLKEDAESLLVHQLKTDFLRSSIKELYRVVQTRQASRGVLSRMLSQVNNLTYCGLLTEDDAFYLSGRLEQGMTRVSNLTTQIEPSTLSDQLLYVPWIKDPTGERSPQDLIDFLTRRMTQVQHKPAETQLYKQFEPVDGMYFLVEGVCLSDQIIELSSPPLRVGKKSFIYPGRFLGERALLQGESQALVDNGSTVSGAVDITVYFLNLHDIHELKQFDNSIVQHVVKKEVVQKAATFLRNYHGYAVLTDNQLDSFITKNMQLFEAGRNLRIRTGKCGILLSGVFVSESSVLTEISPTDLKYVILCGSQAVAKDSYVLIVENLEDSHMVPQQTCASHNFFSLRWTSSSHQQ